LASVESASGGRADGDFDSVEHAGHKNLAPVGPAVDVELAADLGELFEGEMLQDFGHARALLKVFDGRGLGHRPEVRSIEVPSQRPEAFERQDGENGSRGEAHTYQTEERDKSLPTETQISTLSVGYVVP
jgi:hypothetical protein